MRLQARYLRAGDRITDLDVHCQDTVLRIDHVVVGQLAALRFHLCEGHRAPHGDTYTILYHYDDCVQLDVTLSDAELTLRMLAS